MKLAPGVVVEGRYQVLRELGTGGMATVWLVRHERLQSLHALKVLATTLPHLARRLMDEGQAQAALRHPNVVAVSDVIDLDGLPALVMEYVDGPGLEQLQEEVALSLPQVDDLAHQLFAGMEAAHAQGLTHRDLKPENLLIDVARSRPILKIADFGLVKVVREEQRWGDTVQGTFMGTPWYMAPEQSRDAKEVDHRADLFSAGAILYELVTGKQCFPGKDLVDVFARMREGRYAPVEEVVPHTPERMVQAIRWALQPEPDRRCPTVAELRRTWSGGGPPPPPHGWEEPSWRMFVKRWRTKALLLDTASATRQATTPAGRPPELPEASVASTRRPAWPWAVAAAMLLGAALVGWVLGRPSEGDPAEVAVVPPAALAAPAPPAAPMPEAPVVEVAAAPETLALAAPPTREAPRPRPVERPARAEVGLSGQLSSGPAEPTGQSLPPALGAAPASPPPPPRFEVQGAEGLTLSLRGADGRIVELSGASPGRWTLLAFFDPLQPREIGSFDLVEGSVATVRCSAVAKRCQVRVAP